MRVLMTGASGFIGSGVLTYLLEHTDWDFVCICSWRHLGSPLNIQPDARVRVITHDLAGPLPNLGEYDFMLNLASESHVDRSIEHPVEFIENNVSIALNMLEYARQHPPTIFLQFSSDEVFGAQEHEEWDVLLPSNPYAASKGAQELVAIAYWSTYKIPVVISNSNNAVGLNQNREKFVPKIIDLISRGESVAVHCQNGQPGKRYYNPVGNVADALLFMLQNSEGIWRGCGTDRPPRLNLPGGEEVDNLQMAQRVAALMGKPLRYHIVDAELVRPGYDQFYPKTEGQLTAMGWTPPFDLDQELRRIVHAAGHAA